MVAKLYAPAKRRVKAQIQRNKIPALLVKDPEHQFLPF